MYDAGSGVADRYTVVFAETSGFVRGDDGKMQSTHECLLLSSNCNAPNGVNMWGVCMVGKHLGRKVKLSKLPKAVRDCVARRR